MYLAFDMCNVLVDVNMDHFYDFVLDNDVFESNEEIENYLKIMLGQADIGLITAKDAFAQLLYKKKKTNLLNDMLDSWAGLIQEVPAMTDLLNRLRYRYKIKIALLSNISYEHSLIFKNKLSPIFKDCVHHFSNEVGAKKPSKIYFESFIKENPGFNGCFFFDDVEENVLAANKQGLIAHQFGLNTYSSFDDAATSLEAKILQHK